MPNPVPGQDSGRYIVRSDDAARLGDFIDAVHADPQMELLDTIGPPAQPHTVVVAMPHETARTLQKRFADPADSGKFIIEPDRPLSLFGGMQAS